MDTLKVSISSLPDRGLAVEAAFPRGTLDESRTAGLRVHQVRVSGVLSALGHEYLFKGTVSGSFTRACDRCLYEVDLPFEVDVAWTFAHGIERHPLESLSDNGSDEDVTPFQGDVIDLAPRVWEEIVLAYPAKFVACEDRPDLCPECHVDPDQMAYMARSEIENNEGLSSRGLAGLADLFPDLKPTESEE